MIWNYALVIAVAAPLIDFAYGISEKRYWKNRIRAYNNIQWDETSINHFVERATVIDSQFRFLGWWPISILGTLINSYQSQKLAVSLIFTLILVGALWFYFNNLEFSEIKDTWKKYIPLIYRVIGYGVSIVVAVVFPKH